MDIREMRRLAQQTPAVEQPTRRQPRQRKNSTDRPAAQLQDTCTDIPAHTATRGLFAHIQSNNLKSVAVFGAFLFLIQAIQLAVLILVVQPDHKRNLSEPLFTNEMINPMSAIPRVEAELRGGPAVKKHRSPPKPYLERVANDLDIIWTALITSGRLYEGRTLWILIPSVLYVIGGVWFASVFVRRQTGAHRVTQAAEPRLYKVLEKLTIARGLPMPAVEIIDSSGRNAYASGFHPSNSAVGVSRGLLNDLNDAELEAVLAHEVAHIEGRDNRLMTFANLCTGAVASVGRSFVNHARSSPIAACIMVMFFIALVPATKTLLFFGIVFGAWLVAELLRLLISKKREFIADARAIEIMKSPAALISALRKVAANDRIDGLNPSVQAMLISNLSDTNAGTHPSIDARIRAIEETTSVNWADIQAISRLPAPKDAAYDSPLDTPTGFGRRGRLKPNERANNHSVIENENLEGIYKLLVGLDQAIVSLTHGISKFMTFFPFIVWLLIPVMMVAALVGGLTGLPMLPSVLLVAGGLYWWWRRPKRS